MSKFLVTYYEEGGGGMPPDPEMREQMMKAFMAWANSVGDKMAAVYPSQAFPAITGVRAPVTAANGRRAHEAWHGTGGRLAAGRGRGAR
jgi:hypothetical protein